MKLKRALLVSGCWCLFTATAALADAPSEKMVTSIIENLSEERMNALIADGILQSGKRKLRREKTAEAALVFDVWTSNDSNGARGYWFNDSFWTNVYLAHYGGSSSRFLVTYSLTSKKVIGVIPSQSFQEAGTYVWSVKTTPSVGACFLWIKIAVVIDQSGPGFGASAPFTVCP